VAGGVLSNSAVNYNQLLDAIASASVITFHGCSVCTNFFGVPGAIITEAPANVHIITNTITADGTNLVGRFLTTNAFDEVGAGNYVLRWFSKKNSGNRTVKGMARIVTYLNGAAAVTQAMSAVSSEITTSLEQQRVTIWNPNTVAGTQVVFGVEYYIVSSGGSQNTPVLTYLGAEYDAHIETPGGFGSSSLGVRGATGIVNIAATTNTYDPVTRVLGLGTNSFGGGITNAVVKPITVYGTTNPVFTLSESVNVWSWAPPTNVPITCTFSGPGAGYAASGMIRLSRTNNDNSVTWPTNVTWYVGGTRTTNSPTLSNYNRIVVDYFDNMWTLGLVSTNSTSL
jgi:hypothetical protein